MFLRVYEVVSSMLTYDFLNLLYLRNKNVSRENSDVTFLTVFILAHPVNFPCGRKPVRPEKTHDFRQSVDWLFPHESVARIEPTISEVKGASLTIAPPKSPTDLCSFMYTEFTNYLPSLGREGLNEMYDDVRKQLELEKKLRKVREMGILVHTQKSRIL
jgi:hypothetical protein